MALVAVPTFWKVATVSLVCGTIHTVHALSSSGLGGFQWITRSTRKGRGERPSSLVPIIG